MSSTANLETTITDMLAEDPWLQNPSNAIFLSSANFLGTDDIADATDRIKSLELETAMPVYKESALLPFTLGLQYFQSSQELPYSVRVEIERNKLSRGENAWLAPCWGMSAQELASKFAPDMTTIQIGDSQLKTNARAAFAYIKLANAQSYCALSSRQRAHMQLHRSLELCGKNPAVFQTVIEPAVKALLALNIYGLKSRDVELGTQARASLEFETSFLLTPYRSAKQRVENYIAAPKS